MFLSLNSRTADSPARCGIGDTNGWPSCYSVGEGGVIIVLRKNNALNGFAMIEEKSLGPDQRMSQTFQSRRKENAIS